MPLINFDLPAIFRDGVELGRIVSEGLPSIVLDDDAPAWLGEFDTDALESAQSRLVDAFLPAGDAAQVQSRRELLLRCIPEHSTALPMTEKEATELGLLSGILQDCNSANADQDARKGLERLTYVLLDFQRGPEDVGKWHGLLGETLLAIWNGMSQSEKQSGAHEYSAGSQVWDWPQPKNNLQAFLTNLETYYELWASYQKPVIHSLLTGPDVRLEFRVKQARQAVTAYHGYEPLSMLWESEGLSLDAPGEVMRAVRKWRAKLCIRRNKSEIDSLALDEFAKSVWELQNTFVINAAGSGHGASQAPIWRLSSQVTNSEEARPGENQPDTAIAQQVVNVQTPAQDCADKPLRDGPFDADGFRYQGKEVRFGRAAKQQSLVLALWDIKTSRPRAKCETEEVSTVIYGDDQDVEDATFRQLCCDTQRRLDAANIGLKITSLQGMICLGPRPL
jgi:hypothetical protein